jgi:CBS domain containing-hemolysin-like protein
MTRMCLPIYCAVEFVLWPVVRPLLLLTRRLAGGATPARAVLERASVLDALTTGDESETLSQSQKTMVRRLSALRETIAQERMIPLSAVARVPYEASDQEILRVASATGRSRIMVSDSKGERLLGYIIVLDAVRRLPGPFPWKSAVHSLPKVQASDSLLHVLRQLRRAKRPLAAVETSAGTLGIIATADIVDLLFKGYAPLSKEGAGRRKPIS